MNFTKLPKIELHLHLDCSLSYEVVQKIDPTISEEDYNASFIAPAKCTDLADYISRAVKAVDLMQTEEQLQLVTADLFEQLAADRVIYAEIRFAPLIHTEKGLSARQVVEAVNNSITAGIQKTGIQAGLILCTLRHFKAAQSMETVQLVEDFRGTNVLGFDIAADEAGFPIDEHISAFTYAKEKGLHMTAHAGEAKGAASVWETLKYFHPSRIGHGVRSIEDPQLVQLLKEQDIHLEVCPTSNVQTNVVDAMSDHPIDKLYRQGISISINTDGRTISNTSLSQEYQILQAHFAWEKAHFLKSNLEAIRHAFIGEAVKKKLRRQMLEAFQ